MKMINRHNYEEFFILYMDNELDAAGRQLVEDFTRLHPDLHDELDMLLQSRFTPDADIIFPHKHELFAGDNNRINISNYNEWLLLYTDNELDAGSMKEVEAFAAAHPFAKKEMDLLKKTRMQPGPIVFPGKQSLYRREEKVRRIGWWRIAAAAVLLLAATGTAITILDNKTNTGNTVADNSTGTNEPAVNNVQGSSTNATVTANAPEEYTASNTTQSKVASTTKSEGTTVNKNTAEKISNTIKADPELNTDVASNNKIDNNGNDPTNLYTVEEIRYADVGTADNFRKTKPDLTSSQVNPQDIPVTISTAGTSPIYASVVEEEDGRKNKLRGFFRKVTRTFEKRTNIDPTDDDDRLLVGGLAIKL